MKEQMVIDVDLLKESVSPEQVIAHYLSGGLRKSGADYVGLCPFHAEKTPSFKVHIGRAELPDWKCFGCGMSGDIIKFIQLIEGVDFKKSVEILTTQFSGDPRAYQTSTSVQRQRDAAEWYSRQIEGIKALVWCYLAALRKVEAAVNVRPSDVLIAAYFDMERDLTILAGMRHFHGDIHLQDKELREDDGILGEALRYGLNGYAVAAAFDARSQNRYISPIREVKGRLKNVRLALWLAARESRRLVSDEICPDILGGACESLGDSQDLVGMVIDEARAMREAHTAATMKVLGEAGGRSHKRTAKSNSQRHQGRGKPSREHNQQPAA